MLAFYSLLSRKLGVINLYHHIGKCFIDETNIYLSNKQYDNIYTEVHKASDSTEKTPQIKEPNRDGKQFENEKNK